MHTIAKQAINEDGIPIPVDEQVWHGLVTVCGEESLICTCEFTGHGAGAGTYEFKVVKRGGITCEACLTKINEYKAIRL